MTVLELDREQGNQGALLAGLEDTEWIFHGSLTTHLTIPEVKFEMTFKSFNLKTEAWVSQLAQQVKMPLPSLRTRFDL